MFKGFIKDATIIDKVLYAEFDDGDITSIGKISYGENIDSLDIIGMTMDQAYRYYEKRHNFRAQ